MKLPCAVTRDLLPLYAEEMVEQETRNLVEQHLADCPACREKLAELQTGPADPIETAKPLQSLKRQIRKRRLYAAVIAALCVFIAVYTFFCHETNMRLVPWEEGLIEVEGIQTRPREEVYEEGAVPAETQDAAVDVLVLRAASWMNGIHETVDRDDAGTETVILQGWSSNSRSTAREYSEMVFSPIPDRIIYEDGNQQILLWGEAMDGGVAVLPRLALGYYVIIAIVLTLVSGFLWFCLRSRGKSWLIRQVFFAPLSYLAAHLLIKGFRTASFFMERDFVSILLITVALYALLSAAWQVFLQRKSEP